MSQRFFSASRATIMRGTTNRAARTLGAIAVAGFTTLASASAPGGNVDANAIFNRLPRLIDAEPVLDGAWIEVDRDDAAGPGRVVFRRVFDASRAAAQTVAMDRVIAELVPSGQFRIDSSRDVRLPVSELKAEMERLIANDQVRFDGCQVKAMGVRRNLGDGRIIVVPRLRIRRSGQLPALVAECNKIMGRNAAWRAEQVVAVDTEAGQADLVAEPPTPDPNLVLRQALAAVREVPALQGSWLTVDTDDQGHPGVAANLIVFRRAFDSGRTREQAAAMDVLMRRLVPNGRYRVDAGRDLQLPLSSLLAEMRRVIDMDPAFAGCRVDGAAYVVQKLEAQPQFDLLLMGRIWKKRQLEAIHDLCTRLMAQDPAWQAARVGVAPESAKTLVEVTPDPRLSAFHYSDAMHRFWARDYAEADRLLALASLDDPDNLVYRYWRVLAGLAAGDEGQADERLERTIRGFGVRQQSTAHVEVLRSIYRIQGPLRLALMDAERRAMAAVTRNRAGGGFVPSL